MSESEQAILTDALTEAAPQRKISCQAARALAERLNLPYELVGQAANRLGIKIHHCQLGCFN